MWKQLAAAQQPDRAVVTDGGSHCNSVVLAIAAAVPATVAAALAVVALVTQLLAAVVLTVLLYHLRTYFLREQFKQQQ
jgi:hypothetical protein